MTPQQEAVQVLRAWSQVEFFRTYAVPDEHESPIPSVAVKVDEFHEKQNFLLPWIATQLKPRLGIDTYKKTTYTLYLGLFDRAVLSHIAEKKWGFNPRSEEETAQRLDREGWSCFAKLTLDEHGTPLFDTLSVSTLPWAIGQLIHQQRTDLSLTLFDADNEKLKESIAQIQFGLLPLRTNPGKKVLDTDAIHALIEALYQWVGLEPKDLVLPGATSEYLFRMEFSQQPEVPDLKLTQRVYAEQTPDDEPEKEAALLPILNSAYLRDIERAARCVGRGTAGAGLMQFLGRVPERYADLYQDEALSFIAEHFHPGATPPGRWPSDLSEHLSFMQQFAVNASLKSLAEEGLMSVNTPPGTGATSVVQNVVAQNVVARAKVLAGLNDVSEGLTKDGFLHPALTGFEMVLASDHYRDAEQVTRELSEVTSLAKCYQHLSCIRPVAHQMSALRHRNRLQPVKNPDERVWSTIAAVLGTKQKRGDFCERVFQENFWKKEPPAERDPASDHLNLWQYKQQYTGLTFEAAKQQFQTALADYESLNTSFVKYDELRQAQEESRQLQTSLKAQLSSLKQTETTLRISLAAHQENQASLKREIEAAQTKLEAIYPEQPGFFARLFNLGTNQQYQQRLQQQVDHLAELQRQLDDETQTAEEHQHELDVNLHHQVAIERQYEEIKADLVENQQVLIQIKEQLKECQLPGDDLRMTDPQVQRQSFWHNRKTNQLRSEVFITAMTLHEAWIMEALDNRHFAAQFRELENLLTAAPVSQKNLSPLALWQMLFMLTPVISTSLPAFSRMFASLPEQSLGWLMILQAGEVEPQAAVGALMRTKRTLVMGDSQQSPAPMIAPPQLIQAQLSDSMGDGWLQWDPASWSLQQIADRVNPYGCRLDIAGQSQWIGIPLWVHRGCTEPMFSLANQFAYHNRLIPVQDGSIAARPHPVLGENRWIHTPGRCTDKQYKEAVGAETLALLMQAAVQPERVEEIYILSPFKAVVSGVRDYLTAHGESLLAALGWDQHTFNHFLRHHTGTISDFQGQSNETVVLLLGCDIEKRSSAEWFTAMPNLLNVALMCARRHLFVIGDATIWSDKPYVESLCHMLLKEEDRQIAAGEI